jgi:TolA-binding protein
MSNIRIIMLTLALVLLLMLAPFAPAFADDISHLVFSRDVSALRFAQDDSSHPNSDGALTQQLKEQQKKVQEALEKLDRQRKQMNAQEKLLIKQQQQINSLRAAVLKTSHPVTTVRRSQARNEVATQNRPSSPPQAHVGQPPPQEEERPQLAAPSLAHLGGVLTPRGVFSFEPTFKYLYQSSNQFLVEGLTVVPGITIGSESVRSVVNRIGSVTLGGRLGITDRFEVEFEAPFLYREQSTDLSGYCAGTPATCYTGSQTDATGYGLGDISFGAHYQLNSGGDGWPYFVANLLAKSTTGKSPFDVPINVNTGLPTVSPTGTGFWALEPSITMIFPSDPIVFFVNLRDVYQFPANVILQPSNPAFIATPTPAHLAPGNGIGGTIGIGVAINDKASFSLAYEDTMFSASTQNGAEIPGSSYDIGSFDLGFAYTLNGYTSVNLGIQIGATKAAPDTIVTLRIPVKFHVY